MGCSFSHMRDQSRSSVPTRDAEKLGSCFATGYAVNVELEVSLKFSHGISSELAIEAIDTTGVKTQGTQASLEISNVVAAHQWLRNFKAAFAKA
jgi:hypothetical protein